MRKKKSYKLILGLVIGIIISITSVYATTTYYGAASELVYDNSNSSLISENVQDALDELYEAKVNPCPDSLYCVRSNSLSVGDYVSYTPTVTSYTIEMARTGYTADQTIKPSLSKLWRILKINEDNTIDLISYQVSNAQVYFKGETGYLYSVGCLNEIASQYETEGITVGSRHFGYDGQTEFIAKFNHNGSSDTSGNSYETIGGGDILYQNDYDLANEIGALTAYYLTSTNVANYWVASRFFDGLGSSNYWNLKLRYINTSGSLGTYRVRGLQNTTYSDYTYSGFVRPIVTLKAGLLYSGAGTSASPWTIVS